MINGLGKWMKVSIFPFLKKCCILQKMWWVYNGWLCF